MQLKTYYFAHGGILRVQMEKIGIEKENIVRIVANSFLLITSLLGLFVIYVEHLNRLYLIIPIVFSFLFIFAIITEVYECIFYDDTHLIIRSFRGIESINFIDIKKIRRDFIRSKTVHGGGHWRYTIQIKAKDQNTREIIVPFPQLIQNQNLQDLFSKIRKENKNIELVKIEN